MHIQNLTILIKIIYIKRLKYILNKEKMIFFFVIYYKNNKISLILYLKYLNFLSFYLPSPTSNTFSSHSRVPCLALFSLVFIYYKLFFLVLSISKSQYSHIQNFILTVNSK